MKRHTRRRRHKIEEESVKKFVAEQVQERCVPRKTWYMNTPNGHTYKVTYYKCSEHDIRKIAALLEEMFPGVVDDPVSYVRRRTKVFKKVR